MTFKARLYSLTIKLLLPLLFVLLTIQWIIPAVGIYSAKNWYAEQGENYALTVGEWSFVPWRGALSLGQIELRYGEKQASIKTLKVNVGVMDLWQRKITIESLRFDGLKIAITNDANGLSAAGLSANTFANTSEPENDKASASEAKPSAQPASSSWVFNIQAIELNNHAIQFSQPDINTSLNIDKIEITGAPDSSALIINSQLSLQTLSVKPPKIELLQPLTLQVNGQLIAPFSQPQFKGDLQLSGVNMTTPWVAPAGFDQLTLTELDISLAQQSLKSLQLNGLALGEQLLKLKQYTINNITFDKNKLTTGLHEWAELAAVIRLDEKNNIHELTLAAAQVEANESSDHVKVANTLTENNRAKNNKADAHSPQAPTDNKPFELFISHIQQAENDNSSIHAINTHINPNLNIVLGINELRISDVNNKQQPIAFYMRSNTDEYSRVELDAKTVLGANLSSDIKLNIRQFDLIALSGYVEKALGYHVNQGQLNVAMTLNIDDGKLAGDGTLSVLNSQLKPADQATMNSISKQISMPIETALSLIKDDNNNIKMRIPIKGDMNAPDFGLDDLIAQIGRKAVTAATLHYVKQAIFPYGLLVSIAGYVGDELFSITLTPIVYNGDELDDEQQKYLKKVVGLMAEKSTLQLRVCAQVTKEDAKIEGWYATALEKANKIKRNIVEQDEALAERIVLCQPKVADKTQNVMGF